MNRKEAIKAMLEGKRITRTGWPCGEYVLLNEHGVFVDERGDAVDFNTISFCSDSWELYQAPNTHTPGSFAWAREEAKRGKVVYRPDYKHVGFRVEHFGPNVPWNLGHIDATDWKSRDA